MAKRIEHKISLLVPFQSNEQHRLRSWKWLREYWRAAIPDAEIIVGIDRESRHTWRNRHPKPFSKAIAVDNAFRKSHGDIIVIVDADAYIDTKVITHCAERMRAARRAEVHLWFIPYLHLYRLRKGITDQIIESDPECPLRLPTPPPHRDIENPDTSSYGHQYGAMIQMLPREAFELVGGMDPRFRGWGGEDVALVRSVDTLYGKHRNTHNDVLHLWHPTIQGTPVPGRPWMTRIWEGQSAPRSNDKLASQYHRANGNPEAMRALIKHGVPDD